MIAIVAVDKNWGIGCNGNLLDRIPEDMKNFVSKTIGQIIIIGRKTLESFKDGKPLKDRVNVVLTTQDNYKAEGAIVCHSIDEMIELLKTYPGEIFICGGGEIYKQLLPYCHKALVTKVDKEYNVDTYFPDLDSDEEWTLVNESEDKTNINGVKFKFTEYKRKQ